MIVIINYGVGNLISVKNMTMRAGAKDVIISNSQEEIEAAKKLILPGVGHFDFGMKNLEERGFIPILNKKVMEDKIPILGICLGAQLLTRRSDEGTQRGLGFINGETIRFDKTKMSENLKIPHMGWNYVYPRKNINLWEGMPNESRFYFVHSYHFSIVHPEDIWLTTEYGYEFCAAFHYDNIYGCQFHPEKSHNFGMNLIRNFVNL